MSKYAKVLPYDMFSLSPGRASRWLVQCASWAVPMSSGAIEYLGVCLCECPRTVIIINIILVSEVFQRFLKCVLSQESCAEKVRVEEK